MDVHDGFIDLIHSYCDRWCEACAFTSWCRVFAEEAKCSASRDPNLKAAADAPLLPQDLPPAPPRWFVEMIEESVSEAASAVARQPPRSGSERQDDPLLQRSFDYSVGVHSWLADQRVNRSCASHRDPLAVISWYASLIPAKVGRAFSSLAWAEPGDLPGRRDSDGSAKVALLGIERSHAAWLEVADTGARVQSFIADLVWMGEALERQFPAARSFVRPAFDEPEAVARLSAGSR